MRGSQAVLGRVGSGAGTRVRPTVVGSVGVLARRAVAGWVRLVAILGPSVSDK